jgi:hypothetical protein
LIRLSALNLVKDMKTQKEQVAVLSDAGFSPKLIGDILLTNQNVVSVTLNKIRKERSRMRDEDKPVSPNGIVGREEKEVVEKT